MRRFTGIGFTCMVITLSIILLLSMPGCYQPGGSVPEGKHAAAERAWTMEDVDAEVVMTMERIYSPAPTGNGEPPQECDWIHYLRFRTVEGSTDPCDADAVIVLIPGLLGGAGSLEALSRQMVYMALKQRGKHIEVWAMDRRPNNLEDLTGLNAAEEAHDTNVAIDYLYKGAEIGGKKFAGFLGDADVPFLSEFGLELAMNDIYTVITTNFPDPALRREKVFVGGHSLGGPLTALFAGWDFDGDPATLDDAGFMNCAGLIGLDTMLEIDLSSLVVPPVEEVLGAEITGITDRDAAVPAGEAPPEEIYASLVEQMRKGSLPRIVPPLPLGAEVMAMQELVAMEAAWHPDDESTLLRRIPRSSQVDIVLRMQQARALDQFLLPVPSITDFRYTNEALLGIFTDDNFNPINPLQASTGFLGGGAVVRKQFPLPQDLASLPQLSLMKCFINMDGQFVANDAGPSCYKLGRGPLYSWVNFDEIGDASDPDYRDTGGTLTYTTTREEVSDIQDVARFLYKGPSNALEWYFTTRILLDILVAAMGYAPQCGIDFLHGDMIDTVPQIDFVAGNGPLLLITHNLPDDIIVLEGYNHLDVCVAAPDRPSRRPNEVIDPLLDFVLGN